MKSGLGQLGSMGVQTALQPEDADVADFFLDDRKRFHPATMPPGSRRCQPCLKIPRNLSFDFRLVMASCPISMTIQRVNESSHTVLILEGRLDAPSTPILDQEFQGAFSEGARKFIWDCASLSYISSAGLRSFLQALKRLNAHGGTLVIAAAPPLVVEVFEISGFKSLLTLAPDRQTAAAKLN